LRTGVEKLLVAALEAALFREQPGEEQDRQAHRAHVSPQHDERRDCAHASHDPDVEHRAEYGRAREDEPRGGRRHESGTQADGHDQDGRSKQDRLTCELRCGRDGRHGGRDRHDGDQQEKEQAARGRLPDDGLEALPAQRDQQRSENQHAHEIVEPPAQQVDAGPGIVVQWIDRTPGRVGSDAHGRRNGHPCECRGDEQGHVPAALEGVTKAIAPQQPYRRKHAGRKPHSGEQGGHQRAPVEHVHEYTGGVDGKILHPPPAEDRRQRDPAAQQPDRNMTDPTLRLEIDGADRQDGRENHQCAPEVQGHRRCTGSSSGGRDCFFVGWHG